MVRFPALDRSRFTHRFFSWLAFCLVPFPLAAEELKFLESVGGSTFLVGEDIFASVFARPEGRVCYSEGSRLILTNVQEQVWAYPLGTVELEGIPQHACFEPEHGNYIHVALGSAGYKVIDITDPGNPVVIASVPVDGEAIFVNATLNGLVELAVNKIPDNFVELPTVVRLYDITNPAEPAFVDEFGVTFDVREFANVRRVALGEGKRYLADDQEGVAILDVDESGALSFAGSYLPSTGAPSGVAAIGDTVITGGANGIDVYDVENPDLPQFVGALELGLGVRDMMPFPNGQGVFATGAAAGLVAVDLTDPTMPHAFAGAGLQGFSLTVGDGYALVAHGAEGVARYNVQQLPALEAQQFVPHDPVTHFVGHGGYAYAITSPVPVVLELQDLSLLDLGPADFYGANTIVDVVTNGGYLYMVTNFDDSLHIFDLSDPDNPVEVGAVEVGRMTAVDAQDGIVCAVGAVNNVPTLQVIDATVPATPADPTSLPIPGPGVRVAIDPANPDRCYVLTQTGELQSIDISDSDNPQELGSVKLGGDGGSGLAVNDDYVYVGTTEGAPGSARGFLEVVDVSDPADPIPGATRWNLGAPMRDMKVEGNILYGIEGFFIARYDISNPAMPLSMDRFFAPNRPAEFLVAGQAVYTAGEGGYFSLNLDTYAPIPDPEVHKSELPEANAPVALVGDVAVFGPGLNEYAQDIGVRPAEPSSDTEYSAVVGAGSDRVLAAGPDGLDEYKLSKLESPKFERRAFENFLRTIAAQRNRAYVGGPDGMQILDLTTQPATVVGGDTASPVHGVTVSGNFAYTLRQDFTSVAKGVMQVVDISNPSVPVRRGSYSTPTRYDLSKDVLTSLIVRDLGAKNGEKATRSAVWCAYFRPAFPGDPEPDYGHAGLVVIDVTDPDAPEEVDVLPTGKEALGLAVDGDRAYIAAGAEGIVVVDISDATDLKIVETYPTAAPATGVAAVRGRIVATLGPGGLLVLEGKGSSGPDINADGRMDAVDVQLVINGALGIPIPFSADVNNDGATNAVDVQVVINGVLGLI